MITFESDYNNGAHPDVLRRLVESNDSFSASYGADEWSHQAREKIRRACQCPEAGVFLLVGGTQTNATVIDAMLASHEGVIAVDTGHINVHEAGAIEAFGHKIITLPQQDGKLMADDLERFCRGFYADPSHVHMVLPGMVYITLPTELGTLYSAAELERLHTLCRQYDMPLYVDGARLAYALASADCDYDLPWLARHCDAFYIGGTKAGALCGEAVVFPRGNAPRHFLTIVKRHGALLAKSRLAGVQFDALFTDDLYQRIGRHADDMALRLRQLFVDAGLSVKPSPTNQQFVLLSTSQQQRLRQQVAFETWETVDGDHALCRFVTSWATTEAHLGVLAEALRSL